MTDKTKKIIAREGLVLALIVGIGVVIMFIGNNLTKPIENQIDWLAKTWRIDYSYEMLGPETKRTLAAGQCAREFIDDTNKITDLQQVYKKYNKVRTGGLLLIFVYPLYLVIRFIIWAVRMLRK